ncbi:alkaline phosphatase D family protein [Humisphaera borealis]|uniref:Alkaline phosphatase D family protein n=1 Tax=Humisphaera borealis TaxID=2807512 RepID=A0A7M2WSW9_9BACT|nr:alkaline phosphatase D family protein [Humisphaera borealis]QOV88598.1 alkaline phosphatase D family protein [Humisphaera borealis]
MERISRRKLLKDSAVVGGATWLSGADVSTAIADASPAAATGAQNFASQWHRAPDRVWLGADMWANPQQDWRLNNGRAECVNAAPDRNVHLLTHQLTDSPGEVSMSVRVGRVGGMLSGKGSVGFRIGIRHALGDYRSNLFAAGQGLNAGLTAEGGLFIGPLREAKAGTVKLDGVTEIELRLKIVPAAGGAYDLSLSVTTAAGEIGSVSRKAVPGAQLAGNLAIVANFGAAGPRPRQQQANADQPNFGNGSFWFADWKLTGPKLQNRPDQTFGPILWTTYTLHERSLKLTAQMPAIGSDDTQTVRLEIKGKSGQWEKIADSKIEADARLALFRVEKWDASRDIPYRVAYDLKWKDGKTEPHVWEGTIRKDPVDQPVVTVADISCNGHAAFPNAAYTANVAKLNPDIIAFVGDQFYEANGGYGIQRKPVESAMLDYLRKWSMHGWTWRELTRDRPSISIPDDHDVYQGNIWGEGGAPRVSTQEAGGYDMDPRWVNMVHRTHTAHHPDPADPTPAKQGISQYFGGWTYGRISFAILADRMYKSAPEGKVPPTGGRGDHVTDPNFDPKVANLPGLSLLGESQTKFLRDWAQDFRGADLKAVISQTIFTAMATTHGGNREVLRADYDANGWPQNPRNEALREIRKCFALHIAGDQHLPAVVQYGIDSHDDAGVAFAGPAVNVTYPRWWEPGKRGANAKDGSAEFTGQYADAFGNPLTVIAYVNGKVQPRTPVLENMADKASGLGIVRFDKPARTASIECWPFDADVSKDPQFPGWPVKVPLQQNYGRKVTGRLPAINMKGNIQPVIQVLKETDNSRELVYALRPAAGKFEPFVFEEGTYTVRVGNPDLDQWREFKNLSPVAAGESNSIDVEA